MNGHWLHIVWTHLDADSGVTPAVSAVLQVWSAVEVLNILQALVDKSAIVAELKSEGSAHLFSTDGYYSNQSNVLRLLGYFSLVGLLRVHALIGDYQSGGWGLLALSLCDRQTKGVAQATSIRQEKEGNLK